MGKKGIKNKFKFSLSWFTKILKSKNRKPIDLSKLNEYNSRVYYFDNNHRIIGYEVYGESKLDQTVGYEPVKNEVRDNEEKL